MRKLALGLIILPLLASCGTAQVNQRPAVLPLAQEERQVDLKQERLIEESVQKPDWKSTPRVVWAKPVWIPPVIRKIYVPPHEAPDGSMVAGYFVWKIVVPGRWRKHGEKVGQIPVEAVYRSKEVKEQEVSPADAEAILNFLKQFRERKQ